MSVDPVTWAFLILLFAPVVVYVQPRARRGYLPWLPPSRTRRAIRTLQLSVAALLTVVGLMAALPYLAPWPTDGMHVGIGPHEPEPMIDPSARIAVLALSAMLAVTVGAEMWLALLLRRR